MPKSQADKQAAMLEKNRKALDALQAKIDRATSGSDDKVSKAEARVASLTSSLAKAQKSLDAAKNGPANLLQEKARLEADRVWIQAMPVGAVAGVAGEDQVFVDNAEPVSDDAPVYDGGY